MPVPELPTSGLAARRPDARLLPGVFAMVLVGSSVAVSHLLVAAPLFTAQTLRYVVAGTTLLVLARGAREPIRGPRGREWLWLGGVAATGLVLFNVAVVRGVTHAEPAVIAVAVACVPVLLGVVGPLLERRRPARRLVVAAALVTAGSVVVEGTGRADGIGIVWAVVTLLCEAAFTLLAVPVLRRLGAWAVSLHAVWIAAVMLAVLGVVTEGPTAVARLAPRDWWAILYLAVMVTAVAFVCWYSTVSAVGPARAGLLTGIAPVAAAGVGTLIIGTPPGPAVWLGLFIVGIGIAVGLGPGRSAPR